MKFKNNREKRHYRVRKTIKGTAGTPRLAVFRSSKNITAQIIDDDKRVTLVSSNSIKLKTKGTKTSQASEVGKQIALKAVEAKITSVVFDRGGYKYHGRVKAVAAAARENGLKF